MDRPFSGVDYSMAAKLFKRAIETQEDVPVVLSPWDFFALGDLTSDSSHPKRTEIYPNMRRARSIDAIFMAILRSLTPNCKS
jgi:hypothetical protein